MTSAAVKAECEAFLAVAHDFNKIGSLDTEASHPKTARLSQLCAAAETVPMGLQALQSVDVDAITAILPSIPLMEELARAIHATFEAGKKVVLEGCGSTGRLSLSVEVFCLEGMIEEEALRTRVRGFMAGGDAALLRAIEQFEDRVSHGVRQLHEIGFEEGDLLLAITEGGETPFVIAACEEALTLSSNPPYFIYCNPDDKLRVAAERSRRVLDNDGIKKINLTVGPMAITGSTRMQATTVQLACAGLALRHHAHPERIGADLRALLSAVAGVDYGAVAPFTIGEAQLYKDKEFFLYETDYFSVTVLTDTTERAPTFSLPPYENFNRTEEPPSPVYLHLTGVSGAEAGWHRLLRRAPRALEWEGTAERTGMAQIMGYDFSDDVAAKRAQHISADKTRCKAVVSLDLAAGGIRLAIPHAHVDVLVPVPRPVLEDKLLVNIFAKCILNAHSTAVMGIIGRYEGNVMTYVRASNNKLIDRSARYVKLLLERRQEGCPAPVAPMYEETVRTIFDIAATLPPSEPVVLHVVEHYLAQKAKTSAE